MKRAAESKASKAAAAAAEVGRMVDSSQADDRRLIRLVRERRLLYARNNMPVASYYTQVKGLWDDVARLMGWSVADVRRKWSHIRNSYSRHLRNEMHGTCTSRGRMVSRWYLADELEFLREHMATDMRPSSYSSLPTMVDMEGALSEPAPEPVDVKPFPWFGRGSPPAPLPAPAPPLSEDSCGSAAFAPDENCSYFQFFRGLHADYRELPARRRRQFKRRCLALLHELLDAEEQAACPLDAALNLSAPAHSDDERELKPVVDESVLSDTP